MYKSGDKIKVHIYDKTAANMGEIHTRNYDRVFTIVKKGNKPGIYWTEDWTPLSDFATQNGAVVFENV